MAHRTTFALLSLMLAAASLAQAAKPAGKSAKAKKAVKGDGVVISLVGGKEVKGIYLGAHDEAVWVGMDGGEIGIEPDTIVKITVTQTDESEFNKRKEALDPKDLAGWSALAKWAETKGLEDSAKIAAANVVALQPENEEARAILGHVKHHGRWLEADEAKRAQGLILFEGEWLKPAEVESIRAARKEDTEARNARAAASRAARSSAGSSGPSISDQGVPMKSYTEYR